MIKSLYIENLAIIDKVSIDFSKGFTVLTGETGAGKSIIIDAINMVLGERSSREIVRVGAPFSLVVASFSPSTKASQLLFQNEIELSGDEIIIERKVFADGKSNGKINSRPVTATLLKELGSLLLNIHGQHDSQHLLSSEKHIEYLDSLAGTLPLLTAYREKYNTAHELKSKIRSLKMNEQEKSRKIELLSFQCDEISLAALEIGEEESLTERKHLIQNSQKISSALICAYEAFSSEDETNALSLLATSMRALTPISDYSDEFETLVSKISEHYYAAVDLTDEIRKFRDSSEYEPDELNTIEERLDLIYKLKKKYGNSISEILLYYENTSAALQDIQLSDERISALNNELQTAYKHLEKIGTELSKARKTAAKTIQKSVTLELHFLNMPAANFEISILPYDGQALSFSESGLDIVEFLITTNKGDVLRPLAKIVSGGELSRVCLALKNILGRCEDIETLIFDEIDTGVSGSAAEKIGLKLLELSVDKQVLCVTHLSQIASLAENHLLIEKHEGERTITSVKELSFEERIAELARIISGSKITESALNSAKEMLQSK